MINGEELWSKNSVIKSGMSLTASGNCSLRKLCTYPNKKMADWTRE